MKVLDMHGVEHDYKFFITGSVIDNNAGMILHCVYGVRLEADVPFVMSERDMGIYQDLIHIRDCAHDALEMCDRLNLICYKERLDAGDDKEELTPSG